MATFSRFLLSSRRVAYFSFPSRPLSFSLSLSFAFGKLFWMFPFDRKIVLFEFDFVPVFGFTDQNSTTQKNIKKKLKTLY